MVPMRDGVRLATDVYRPAEDGEPVSGRWPAVLARFGYDKEMRFWIQPLVERLVPEGYAVVVQDIRGRYKSEGDYYHTVSSAEGTDGYDTVEWTAAQNWCDGRVATTGVSLGASVQGAMAMHRPPHLAAMMLEDGPLSYFHNGIRQGGAMELRSVAWAFYPAVHSREARADAGVLEHIEDGMAHLGDLLLGLPLKEGQTPLSVAPRFEAELLDYCTHGEFSDYWRQDCLWYDDMERHADVPTLVRCGWYDSYSLGMSHYFQRLVSEHKSPTQLIYGPWIHGSPHLTYAGDVDFGTEAAVDMDEVRSRYFGRWLKDGHDGRDDAPVRIFVMGGGDGRRNTDGRLNHGGRWRDEEEWPLVRAEQVRYHVHGDGSLNEDTPVGDDAALTYVYDPQRPVPTISANASGFYKLIPPPEGVRPQFVTTTARMRSIVAQGASDQVATPEIFGGQPPYGPLAVRDDVLVFQTEPLESELEVTGPIFVKLWVSSSEVDTDFTAKLIDVHPPSDDYPDGYAMNLCDSVQRMRYRNGYETAEMMRPGEVYEVTVELPPTSNLFVAGHRVRVDVSSSNFPRFEPNPNTGEPMGRHTRTIEATNTVYVDSSRPSHVVLPIIR